MVDTPKAEMIIEILEQAKESVSYCDLITRLGSANNEVIAALKDLIHANVIEDLFSGNTANKPMLYYRLTENYKAKLNDLELSGV